MKHSSYKWLLPLGLLCAALVLISCSEDREREDERGPHPSDWMTLTSSNFHGWPALVDSATGCRGCHGATLHGGEEGRSCYDCHAYLHTQVTRADPETHQSLIAFGNDWHIQNCTVCHGTNYDGGRAGVSCRACHTEEDGPAECGVCHAMPPTDTTKVPFGMDPAAAGAHATHERFSCRECHGPSGGLTHVGPLPAEVLFSRANLANIAVDTNQTRFTHIGEPTSGNGACSNIYCHSNGKVVEGRVGAPVAMPQWVGGALACGGCHRTPPPLPHQQVTTCGECHGNVDPASDNGLPSAIRFLDDSTHIDGHVTF